MTSRVLVLYATREQQTAKIASRVAETLRARGQSVELVDADRRPSNILFSLVDAVIVAAPIHAGGYPKSIQRFARANASRLDTMPNAFISVGLAVASRTTDGRAETQVVVDGFVRKTGWHPKRVEMVAGALLYTRYNPFIRFIMRRISAAAGGDVDTSRDYEYTDWAALDRLTAGMSDEFARAATLHSVDAPAMPDRGRPHQGLGVSDADCLRR